MVSHRDQSQVHCFVPVQFYSPEPTTDIITLTSYPDVLKFEVEKLWQYKVYSCGGMQRDDVTPAARHKNVFVVVFVVVCNVKPNDALHGKANKQRIWTAWGDEWAQSSDLSWSSNRKKRLRSDSERCFPGGLIHTLIQQSLPFIQGFPNSHIRTRDRADEHKQGVSAAKGCVSADCLYANRSVLLWRQRKCRVYATSAEVVTQTLTAPQPAHRLWYAVAFLAFLQNKVLIKFKITSHAHSSCL